MRVDGNPISSGHESHPRVKRLESFMKDDVWAFSCTGPRDTTDHVISLTIAKWLRQMVGSNPRNRGLQSTDLCGADGTNHGFVHDTEHGYNIRIFRLSDEFGDNSDVIQGALSVGQSHDPPEEVDVCSSLPRVVVAYGLLR